MSEPSLPDKIVAIDRALQDADVPHAFGGAIALAYYAEPRATVDVDVNVFLGPDHVDAVYTALSPLGITPPPSDGEASDGEASDGEASDGEASDGEASDRAQVGRDGQTRWWWGRTPIDVFFAYDPVHDAMRDEVRSVPFGDDRIPVLGPEHLVVCKVVFDRDKDWLDIVQVLTAVPDFDSADVRRWLDHLLRADDPRRRHFDEIAVQMLGR